MGTHSGCFLTILLSQENTGGGKNSRRQTRVVNSSTENIGTKLRQMKKDTDAVQRTAGIQERNRLVAFSFCAALIGFVLAMYLGAFAKTDLKEFPGWISAFAAVGSVAVSAVAVYFVAGTLRATISTLAITKEMAAAQSEAYDIEFRPQVLPDEVKIVSVQPVEGEESEVAIRFTFQNYGKMAALRVAGQVIAGDVQEGEPIDMEIYTGFWVVALFRRSTLRPNGTFDERVVIKGKFADGQMKLVSPRLQYDDERGNRHFDIEKTYYFLRRECDKFSIKQVGPFEVSPHAGFNEDDIDWNS